jgi:hypothetical protein
MELACNSTTEFTALEKKEFSADGNPENFQRTFAAAEVRRSTVRWEPESNQLVESVELQKNPGLLLNYSQYSRPLHLLDASQGYDGNERVEQFPLWQAGTLDILIVIDNSNTMAAYQANLANRLEPLLENIKNTNWRIAVVTTDNPCLRGMISRSDYDANQAAAELAFKNAITVGTNGSTVERGIEMAIKGFAPETYCGSNPVKWTRDSAKTAVIMVSDEANCGSASNEGCNGATGYTYFGPADFVAGTPNGTRFFGLLHEEVNPLCEATSGYERQPDEYYGLATSTGGLWRPICQVDYTEVLGEISRNVGATLTREFELSAAPTDGSLRVYLDDQEITAGFSVLDRKITLIGNEGAATNVQFRYRHGSKERFDAMQLVGEIDPASLKVMVNGELADASDYQVDMDAKMLNFMRRPQDYAKVQVSYREPGELLTEFSAPTEIVAGSLEVKVNGEETKEYSYDPIANKVHFPVAPEDGAEIVIRGRRESDYVLEYKLRSGDMVDLASMEIVDGQTGEPVDGVIEGNVLILPMDAVENLNTVSVIFTLDPDPESFTITLPEEPIVETMVLKGSDDAQNCLKTAPREGRTIHAGCLAGQKETITVDFDYVVRRVNQFTVELPRGMRIVEWTVRVDGESVPFERDGLTFSVDPAYLSDTSRVMIDGRPRGAVVASSH